MSAKNSIILNNVYYAFKEIPQKAWPDIIQYYESHVSEIKQMTQKQQIEMQYFYLEALFEVRDSKRLLEVSTPFIIQSLSDNIPADIGRGYYEDGLFWKAQTQIRLMKYDEAIHILQELVRMNPSQKSFQHKLWLALFYKKPKWVQISKAISILLFLTTAIVVLFEILIVNSFYNYYLKEIQLLRNVLFFFALLLVGIMEAYHAWNCHRKVQEIVP